jgi:hypothetical protein
MLIEFSTKNTSVIEPPKAKRLKIMTNSLGYLLTNRAGYNENNF